MTTEDYKGDKTNDQMFSDRDVIAQSLKSLVPHGLTYSVFTDTLRGFHTIRIKKGVRTSMFDLPAKWVVGGEVPERWLNMKIETAVSILKLRSLIYETGDTTCTEKKSQPSEQVQEQPSTTTQTTAQPAGINTKPLLLTLSMATLVSIALNVILVVTMITG